MKSALLRSGVCSSPMECLVIMTNPSFSEVGCLGRRRPRFLIGVNNNGEESEKSGGKMNAYHENVVSAVDRKMRNVPDGSDLAEGGAFETKRPR